MGSIKAAAGAAFSTFWQNLRADSGKKRALGQKSEYGVWAETINPLRGLTEQRARDVFDQARLGIYAEIAYLYQEIEAADPTLLTCVERRESVVGTSKWKILPCNPERTSGYDQALADEQKAFLYEAYGRADDSLGELAEHLERGFFRGFAHARPIYGDGTLDGFELYDAWNFALDRLSGTWWWNPDASTVFGDAFSPIPEGELVSVVRSRHIDYPALLIFIRAALGEKKWGVFLERYGIPPVTVIMPQHAEKADEAAYFTAAQDLAAAGCGALPFGSQVSYATEARGTNPFIEFLRHQQELIVLMATGGTLTSLASPTGIGSGTSDVQEKSWRQIVGRDIRVAGRAVNRVVTPRLLASRFPGRPVLVMFAYDPDPDPTAEQVFAAAAAAKSGGYLIDRAQLEDASGYKLVLDASPAAAAGELPPSGAPRPLPIDNKASRIVATPLQNASGAPDGKTPVQEEPPPQNANAGPLAELEKSLSADLRPVADRVAALLALPEAERAAAAAALAKELPGLLPRDPEMAAILEAEIAEAFAGAAVPVKNIGTSAGALKGWETRRRNGWTPEQFADAEARMKSLVADLDKAGPDGKGKGWKNRTESFGRLDSATVADIQAANPKMRVAGSEAIVDTKQLSHALEGHAEGREKHPGQIPITKDDLGKIPDVLSDYDGISPGKGVSEGKSTEAVIFRKRYPDGTIACVEVDMHDGGRDARVLKFQTMWKEAIK